MPTVLPTVRTSIAPSLWIYREQLRWVCATRMRFFLIRPRSIFLLTHTYSYLNTVRKYLRPQPATFVCFAENPQTKYQYYAVGLCISSVFLLVTLLVYITLPKVRQTHPFRETHQLQPTTLSSIHWGALLVCLRHAAAKSARQDACVLRVQSANWLHSACLCAIRWRQYNGQLLCYRWAFVLVKWPSRRILVYAKAPHDANYKD